MNTYNTNQSSKITNENDENIIVDRNRKNKSYGNYRNKDNNDNYYKNKISNDKKEGTKLKVDETKNKTELIVETEDNKYIVTDEGSSNLSDDLDNELVEENDIEKRNELKELANICLENNLTINNENIQIIRKLKEKRRLEDRLKKNEDIKDFEEKRQILEEIEYHEWADREKRIKELQEKKMKLLKRVIIQRDTEKADKIFYEVEKVIQNRDKNKDQIIENFEKEKAKDIRNQFIQKKNNLKTIFNQKTDIIDDMNDYTSNYNLELERNGIIPPKIDEPTSNKIDNLLNTNDIDSLTRTFNKSLDSMHKDKKYDKLSKYEKKKNKDVIDTFYRYLNKEEKQYTCDDYLISDTNKTAKKMQCIKINFPSIDIKNNEEDTFEKNVLYLQNLLRGKAIKKLMDDGKHSCIDLIEELKTYAKIDQYSSHEKEVFEKENFEEIKIDAYLENMQGKYTSELLDSLSNELEKYEEERKIAILVKYAERERRLKECKEKGKRQAELLLREKEDYLFNEIMGLNNQTVDSYLEDILTKAINDSSKEEALIRTKKKTEQLNEIYNSLDNQNDEHNKFIVKDLVGNFIIPYVDKQRGAEFDLLEQKKNNYISNFATQHVFSKINEAF
ncbi:conserved Plasmodium protein, unknown function [Plasmodium vinckei brucechwatti]|uniref:Cilia- and flagella-associated protein 91 n=1 Tax=Plasmodium vinckei brucechwatti TaxID=119398 RepID=A0A6V7SWS8_PLAVN|nr:conserved Plasmodium protein, unknown function [Plasmodium vinckei brucechwatti]